MSLGYFNLMTNRFVGLIRKIDFVFQSFKHRKQISKGLCLLLPALKLLFVTQLHIKIIIAEVNLIS
jgi:hypothetical protein